MDGSGRLKDLKSGDEGRPDTKDEWDKEDVWDTANSRDERQERFEAGGVFHPDYCLSKLRFDRDRTEEIFVWR